jgi:hypothetical protein
VGPRAGLDGRKISPTPGFDPRTVHPVVSRYTDCAKTLDPALYKTINPALNTAVILLYIQIYVVVMLVLFVTENSDVATLRGKDKESEIVISRLVWTETTRV